METAKQRKITWQALEHEHQEKSNDWFWAVGIISISGAVLAVFFGNLLFGLLILLIAFVSILQGNKVPRALEYEISRKGVRVGEIIYPYSTLESFWVIDEEINDLIYIKSQKTLMPLLVLPYDSMKTNPDHIRDYLLEYIDEEELNEPLSQVIMERLGF